MASILNIEGIGEKYAELLREEGIRSTTTLLERGATPTGRKEIAENTGISLALILEWVNHADLFRVRGIGKEYSDLLEEAGVDTVVELAQRNPKNLYETLVTVNNEKKLVRKLPSQKQVESWINRAKNLPRKVSY
jgi:predicted flap endonuclease-1-like 5' DNA nuclease